MELVLTAPALDGPGGIQSYLLTTAAQLERLGHEVWLYAPVQGLMATVARERGLRVVPTEEDLPHGCDAVLAQDSPTLLAMADRYPGAARLMVAHGAEYDICLPPGVEGVVSVAVALNDAVARRLRALAAPPPIVRLRQPVDTARFVPGGPLPARPRRVLLLGNYLESERRDAFVAACAAAGLAYGQIGLHGEFSPDPVAEIAGADIVVAVGRSAIEGMSCGRAVWVYSGPAGDGWVTPESYGALEADGFRGRATGVVLDAAAFARALADYAPGMGDANRSLAVQHHRGYEHASGLVEALADARPAPRPTAPLRELARLIRVQYDAQARLDGLLRDLEAAHRARLEALAAADRARADLARVVATRRWRAAGLAARPLEAARRAARRRP